MKQYEYSYKVFREYDSKYKDVKLENLNKLGAEGWLLCGELHRTSDTESRFRGLFVREI